ncbi:N-6 DNA methylase [Frigoribacterium sp. Leaf172]|uniref:N-6 DNA methylase n=1 Tax=Frigoribacterium sp. Leaf172 TaxID=1736285 RepID=UPI0006FD91CF|nr:N-6 DNA methylase [Frigoribacterium sp. Leaf172]KQR65028.1 N-6 DNA methylase [Frigoribacterium sp. Leaf172]
MALIQDDNVSKSFIVPPGKILDFIDGSIRSDTPEEYVRQEILKSLVREYKYRKQNIAVEWPLKIGSKRVRADIAIFPDGIDFDHRSQSNVSLIIECKKSGTSPNSKTDGIEQLVSYMSACSNAHIGMWTNGTDLAAYRMVTKDGLRIPDEIPDIPHFGDVSESDRPEFNQLRPAASDSLLFAFRRAHDYISGNQGMQKPEAFWELLKLIFCKIHDERESARPEFYASPLERTTAAGLIRINKRIGTLFSAVKATYPQIFKAAEEIELQPNILAYIVTQLQMFSLLSSDVDVKGKAYEEVVGSNLRGDRGEFFTPRNVCRMMVEMIDPDERDLILDPACGTGGFLISAMNYVVEGVKSEVRHSGRSDTSRDDAIQSRVQRFLRTNLIGLDFNPNLVRATKMNMVMNNDGSGGLFQANSLAPAATWTEGLRDRELIGNVDVIITNPPFGSKIPIDDPTILSQYELGHAWTYVDRDDLWVRKDETTTRPPEILFIERCVKFLKPGSGVAAMVLPDGILGSPGLGFVRQWLLENTIILASIDLHPDTFQPGTSVQTSVLIVRRKSPEQLSIEAAAGLQSDYDIFMAICDHIGHDKRGNTVYVRDEDGYEVVAEVEEAVTANVMGPDIPEMHRAQERVPDDNTLMIAKAFREWMSLKEE